jgi:hypothetical protein
MNLRSYLCLFLLGLVVFPTLTTAQNARQFDLFAALSRVPMGEWETIAYSDFSSTMTDLGEVWTPASDAALTPGQEAGWVGVWKPDLFTLTLEEAGFSAWQVESVVEARVEGRFIIWLEGRFDPSHIAASLPEVNYGPVSDFPAESFQATVAGRWQRLMPYVAIPDGHTLLIAATLDDLRAMLDVYDGQAPALIDNDELLRLLTDVPTSVTSRVVRLNQTPTGCPAEHSQMVAHGLAYISQDATWQYVLDLGFAREVLNTELQQLGNALEYSTWRVLPYDGVAGQHTRIVAQQPHQDDAGTILQFTMNVQPDAELQHIPFDIAAEPDTCRLFSAPPAAATALAVSRIPDLSGGRLSVTIRYGNAEQALYNAGLNEPLSDPRKILNERQQASLNSTWRTALAFESDFMEWFGFPPQRIHQTIDLTMDNGEYVRVLWGDFTVVEVEAALVKTGYVAVEQYLGTRVYTLRQVPESGGVLLSSLTQIAAAPQDGVLLFTNQTANARRTMDILDGSTQSLLMRSRELVLVSRATEDATNAILRRYINPVAGGLVCNLPPYRAEGFANVLRPDGWHFLYALGFNRTLEDAETIAGALADVLESSDHPLQGPGSATLGELSSVTATRWVVENGASMILVDLRVEGTEQQASFFGQDLAQAALPPCALGDIAS